ncbi:MAG: hypothetical protein KDB80_02935, partial [Planctomycetes bacterium]|nr:hypothetical protein [Planctomycetota bacterium]
MFALASNRRKIPLAVQLWTGLTAAAVGLSLLVSTVVSDARRRDTADQLRRGSHRAAEALAQRAAPLLDRGDQLRLAVLAASVADVSAARVLLVGKDGTVCLDTGLSLGGQRDRDGHPDLHRSSDW